MPASFSYTVISGGIRRKERTSHSPSRTAAPSRATTSQEVKMYGQEHDRWRPLFEHPDDEHDCSCCPLHDSRHNHHRKQVKSPHNMYTTTQLHEPPRKPRAFFTEGAYIPTRSHPDLSWDYTRSPAPSYRRAYVVSPHPYARATGHAFYPDEITGRSFDYIQASPVPRPTRPRSSFAERSNIDSTVPDARRCQLSEMNTLKPMAFKAAAEKLFLVLVKAEKFLDIFLQSFKQETAAAYMDRVSAWKRKVDRYNKDLVVPELKLDGKLGIHSHFNHTQCSDTDNCRRP